MMWLDRWLIMGPHLVLCTTQKRLDAVVKHLGYPERCKMPVTGASVRVFENPTDDMVCVVTIAEGHSYDPIEIAAVLTHEAVHVWQSFAAQIGEKAPSAEFEAYAIQIIAKRLMREYVAQTARA